MGSRGPKGKGEAYHDLTGTPNWAGPDQSPVPAGRPKRPKGVSKDALKIFRMLCKMLAQRRALTAGDGEILGLYCTLYDRHERAKKAFGKSLQAFNHVYRDRVQRETLGFTDHECRLPAQPKKRVALVPRRVSDPVWDVTREER